MLYLLLALGLAQDAPQPPLPVTAGQPYSVMAEYPYDPTAPEWFYVTIDGAQLFGIVNADALKNGMITVPNIVIMPGQHSLVMCAANSQQAPVCSDPLVVVASTGPAKPTPDQPSGGLGKPGTPRLQVIINVQ